ncbi:histidine kinase [Nonomuraea sp. NPDC050404]|uniref:sensor histidine kinase n=1 Tax=Nonomuraea sp. NPDC050404 TaxID=3155783 RepID=UPI0033C7FE33
MLSQVVSARAEPVRWPSRLPAAALTAATVAFAGCAIAVMVTDDALGLVADTRTWLARSLGLGAGLAVAAWTVLRRDPRHGVGLVLLIASAGLSLAGLGQALRELGEGAGAFMAGGPLAVLRGVAIFAQHGALAVLPLFYPGGRLTRRRLWWVPIGMAVVHALYLAPLAWYGRDRYDRQWTSQAMAAEHPWWGALGEPVIWMPRIVAAAAAFALARRAARTQGAERLRMRAMVACQAYYWTVATVYAMLPHARGLDTRYWPDLLIQGPSTLGIAMIAIVAAAPARLSPVIRVARLLFVLEGLALGLWITYRALALTIEQLAPAAGPAPAAAVAALLVRPLAGLLWRATNLLFYGRRNSPDEAVRALARQLRDQHDSGEVAMIVCRTVVERLGLPAAELTMPTRSGPRTLASVGETGDGAALGLPLYHRARHVGTLTITARPGEAALDARDRAAINDLAAQAAPVIAALRLHADLLASRERIVTTREEERRRLRRDLHDGLGPSMAGIGLRLDAARRTLDAGSPVATIFGEVSGEITRCLREIRQIIEDLRPPALDDMGLPAALTHLAAGFGADVHTSLPAALPALPAATEAAAYRIAAEALTNAIRHSGADRIDLTAAIAGPWLEVRVADDGAGLPAVPAREGVGLRSMTDRAEEIGGTLTLGPGPGGGTIVRARLPLHLP